MAPKETQKIEIEKTHRDSLLPFNQAVTVDGASFLGTALIANNNAVRRIFRAGKRVGTRYLVSEIRTIYHET
jgi:hypothetical protein